MLRQFCLASSLILAALSGAAAHETRLGPLTLGHAWTRATPPAASIAGGYLSIANAGPEADTLIGGTFEASARLEIHTMAVEAGIMTMRPLPDGLPIPPGGRVDLKPGGYHLMLMGLKRPLKQGETVKGTLDFRKAGRVEVEFSVEGFGATQSHDAH